ncbi:MAG: hypothetical protein ABI559_12540 [Chloroflexota bacterium]
MASNDSNSAANRAFDFVLERQATIFDAVRTAADRYHRFNHSLIEGARSSAQEWTQVGQHWLDRPTDLMGLWEASVEALGNGQQRSLALFREWLEDRVEVQRESSEAIRRGLGDVRDVVERVQANAPEFLRRGIRRNGSEERAIAEAG